jgi:hypothetical protein
LSAATINLPLSAIRRLADEAAECSLLSPELAIGVRRVKGVKRLGRRIGNWLSGDQVEDLLNEISLNTLTGERDAAMIGFLVGCGLRRSEVVSLRLDQPQSRGIALGHCRFDREGRTDSNGTVPNWCKTLIDIWLRDSGVADGKIFRRIWKNRTELAFRVTTDVVWTAVKRYATRIGIGHLAPHIGCRQKFKEAVNDRFKISIGTTARYPVYRARKWRGKDDIDYQRIAICSRSRHSIGRKDENTCTLRLLHEQYARQTRHAEFLATILWARIRIPNRFARSTQRSHSGPEAVARLYHPARQFVPVSIVFADGTPESLMVLFWQNRWRDEP